MPVDRILEAELAVEQKSDQGVEGPGGTGGGGSSVSDGIDSFSHEVGVGRRLAVCLPSPPSLLSIPPSFPYLALN